MERGRFLAAFCVDPDALWNYAQGLWKDPAATLDDLREAVTTHEEVARTARRVLGGAHPFVELIERALPFSRALLHSREMPRGA